MQGKIRVFLRRTHFFAKLLYFSAIGCLVIFLMMISLLRFWILPHINHYRTEIADFLTQSSGIPIQIKQIEADWESLRPRLALNGLSLLDKQRHPALSLNVETQLDWWTLISGQVSLSTLTLSQPKLFIQRDQTGQFFIAGIPIKATPSTDSQLVTWLLSQPKIAIQNGEIIWEDLLQKKPPLYLSHLDFTLEKSLFLSRHQVTLQATLPPELGAHFTLSGEFYARTLTELQKLTGEFQTNLQIKNFSSLSHYLALPIQFQHGQGQLALQFVVKKGLPERIESDLNVHHLNIQTQPNLPFLAFREVRGHVELKHLGPQQWQIDAKNMLGYLSEEQQSFLPARFTGFFEFHSPTILPTKVALNFSEWHLNILPKLSPYVPLPPHLLEIIQKLNPAGKFIDTIFTWEHAQKYTLKSRFEDLSFAPFGSIPGLSHLYGSIQANESDGNLTVQNKTGQAISLNYPDFFETILTANSLNTRVKWHFDPQQGFELNIPNCFISNQHAEGTMNMTYRTEKGTPGYLDLSAKLTRADGRAVHYYLPKVIAPAVRTWVKQAILGGKSNDVRFKVKGPLKDFPFVENKNGIFEIAALVQNGQLEFIPGWQKITDIHANLLFSGKKMLIQAQRGLLHQTQLSHVKVSIPDLLEPEERLYITGKADGPTRYFLDYLEKTPVGDLINHATKDMVVYSGQTKLDLNLFIPLRHVEKTEVKGDVTLFNNRALLQPSLPILDRVQGGLIFTEKGVNLKPTTGIAFGGPVSLKNGGLTTPHLFSFNLEGQTHLKTFLTQQKIVTLDPLLNQLGKQYLEGTTNWQAAVTLDTHKNQTYFTVTSPLNGIESKLPAPLNKKANENLPLKIEWQPTPANKNVNTLQVNVGNELDLHLLYNQKFNKIEKGLIQVGEENKKSLTNTGVWINIQKKSLNINPWLDLVGTLENASSPSKNNLKNKATQNEFPLAGAFLKTENLIIGPKKFQNIQLVIKSPSKNLYQINVNAKEAKGEIHWSQQGRSKSLLARFKYFNTPDDLNLPSEMSPTNHSSEETLPQDFPSLDVIIDQFTIKNKKLGKLEMLASPQGKNWQIDKLNLILPDGKMTMKGIWYGWLSHHQTTRANIEIEASDVGKLLAHLGQPNTIKRGVASLSGQVSWQGKPSAVNTQTMHGTVTLDAKNGQFLKADPGIGKLLGVLSLQALPRRITLDFKDVFSEGFSFDTVTAHARIDNGILSSQDFLMNGSVAQVTIKGDVNLNQETQKLRVWIMPSLTDGMTILSFLGGPATGITSYIVQKILRNPVEQMLAFEYNITGNWNNPKVEKMGLTPPPSNSNNN